MILSGLPYWNRQVGRTTPGVRRCRSRINEKLAAALYYLELLPPRPYEEKNS